MGYAIVNLLTMGNAELSLVHVFMRGKRWLSLSIILNSLFRRIL